MFSSNTSTSSLNENEEYVNVDKTNVDIDSTDEESCDDSIADETYAPDKMDIIEIETDEESNVSSIFQPSSLNQPEYATERIVAPRQGTDVEHHSVLVRIPLSSLLHTASFVSNGKKILYASTKFYNSFVKYL